MMGQSMLPIIAKEKIIIILNFWESDYNNRYPSMQDFTFSIDIHFQKAFPTTLIKEKQLQMWWG
jgi:hypothetical protein